MPPMAGDGITGADTIGGGAITGGAMTGGGAMIGGGAKHMLRQGLEATGGCDEAELNRLNRLLLAAPPG